MCCAIRQSSLRNLRQLRGSVVKKNNLLVFDYLYFQPYCYLDSTQDSEKEQGPNRGGKE